MQVVRSEVVAELLSEQRTSHLDEGEEDALASRPTLLRILAFGPTRSSEPPNPRVLSAEFDSDGDLDVPRRRKRPRRLQRNNAAPHSGDTEALFVLETTEAGDANATGTQVWRASFVMAEFIQSQENEFRGAVVLELGCGVGFVAIAAARVARLVIATDGDASALAVCARNLLRNCPGLDRIRVRYWDWEDESTIQVSSVAPKFQWAQEDQDALNRGVDWILASDVFYDDEIADRFLDKLHHLLSHHPHARAVVSMEKRIVFSAVTLSEISLGYDAFRARLCVHEASCHTATPEANTVHCSECARDTHEPTARFVAAQIPVNGLPRVYQYEQVSTLEIWELRAVVSVAPRESVPMSYVH